MCFMTLSVDSDGLLNYPKLYTGFGPINEISYLEHAVIQAIKNDPNSHMYYQLIESRN